MTRLRKKITYQVHFLWKFGILCLIMNSPRKVLPRSVFVVAFLLLGVSVDAINVGMAEITVIATNGHVTPSN